MSLNNNPSFQSNQPIFEQQFANIFDDEEMVEVDFTGEEDLHNVGYFCIFCPETFKDRDEARRHYQKHVNYYSMMCSLCGEGATDMQEFLRHHTEVHPEAKKGRYKRREQPIVDKWINGFLYAQATITRAFPPRDNCPVCEKIFSPSQIETARSKRVSFSRKIDHIHRHLCYLPYECMRCKEEGKEYSVAYFESKASNHIELKHPEVDNTGDSRWNVFQKTISITKLDDFIASYLAKFGISMDYEKRPKKVVREVVPPSNGADEIATCSRNNALPSSSEILPSNNDNGVIVLDDDEDADQSQAGDSSVASEEPADGNSMIVSVSPSHAEYIESGRTSRQRRHSEEYFCLFCNAKFPCKLDAYPHFGEHLEYKPVLCLLCDNKFHDTDAFTLHHQLHHPEAQDLKYEIREDQNIERWVDEFLESQTTPLSSRLTLNCSCATCCPVCERLTPRRNLVASGCAPCNNHNDVSFAEHIHQHLAYNAYECTFCRKLGNSTRLPNLDSAALNHVRENHYVRDATLYQLSRTFPKTLTIAKLERYIAEAVQKRRLLEKKWRLYKNEQIKMERLKMQQQFASGGRFYQQPMQFSPNYGIASLNRDNSHPQLRNNPFPGPFKNNVNHVRVEGGRVVNLPSPLSIKAIQQRNLRCKSNSSLHTNKNNLISNNSTSGSSVMNLSTRSISNNHNNNLSGSHSGNNNHFSLNYSNSSMSSHNMNNSASLMMNMMMNMHNNNLINSSSSSGNGSGNASKNNNHDDNNNHDEDNTNNNSDNNNNNTIDLTNDPSLNDEGVLGMSTGVRFFVKCLHCNIELPNRKQLKVHHRQAHPGLTMACFTTPKPIMSSEVSP